MVVLWWQEMKGVSVWLEGGINEAGIMVSDVILSCISSA